jgi:nitrite reductase/ring-hydroxylating ferredoxin subunit
MPTIKAGKVEDLPPGDVIEVLCGEQPYAVCNFEGGIYALNGVCIHLGGPLGQGQLEGGTLTCPYHFWEFDCRTGECLGDPSRRVATYPVRIENGQILIEVP